MSKLKKTGSLVKSPQSAAGITPETGEVIKTAVDFVIDVWVKITNKKK